MSELAILGGRPVLEQPLPAANTMGQAELESVIRVVKSGRLSGFYGNWGAEFLGGPEVRAFEEAWAGRFKVKHAVAVNSASSGLLAAMGAIGLTPGDEVIVPPYTMSATAMAPLMYGGIPVFADIEATTFCLDLDAVRAALTPRTRAIVAVNLFGHPAALAELRALTRERGIWLVEDNAQGPLAMEHGRYAGTVGDIGVFSLNYHKHIHTGEGGLCVTDSAELALRLQMIRNHGENVVETVNPRSIANLVGFNLRMTELSAAIGRQQLARIDEHVGRRQEVAEALTAGTEGLEGLIAPRVRAGCRHVYYIWALRTDEATLGVSRNRFSEALCAEGFPHWAGYVRPLYLLPIFQRRIAIGDHGYPFDMSAVRYAKGMCPVAERMHERELLGFETCAYRISSEIVHRLVEAIRKVHTHRRELAAVSA